MGKLAKSESLVPEIFKDTKDQLWTTSLDVADKFEKRHKNVLRSIDNLECSEGFKRLNFEPLSQKVRGGTQEYYIISKEGFSFLVMGFTGKRAAEWKEKYITAFKDMEIYIKSRMRQQSNRDWMEVRYAGKFVRREETDMIQKFVEYATEQGSSNAEWYYKNLSGMVNDLLFGIKPGFQFGNVRDNLNKVQLLHASTADELIRKTLIECMDMEINYKDIYKMVKEKIEEYVAVVGKMSFLVDVKKIKQLSIV